MKTIIKKIIYTILLVMIAMLFISCEKDDTIKPIVKEQISYHQDLSVKNPENPHDTIQNNFNWDPVISFQRSTIHPTGMVNLRVLDSYMVFSKPYIFNSNKTYTFIVEHKDNFFLKEGRFEVWYKPDTTRYVRNIFTNKGALWLLNNNPPPYNNGYTDTTLFLIRRSHEGRIDYSTYSNLTIFKFKVNIKPEHQGKPIRLLIVCDGIIRRNWDNFTNAKLLESN